SPDAVTAQPYGLASVATTSGNIGVSSDDQRSGAKPTSVTSSCLADDHSEYTAERAERAKRYTAHRTESDGRRHKQAHTHLPTNCPCQHRTYNRAQQTQESHHTAQQA